MLVTSIFSFNHFVVYSSKMNFILSTTFESSSVNALDLNHTKIWLVGKELTLSQKALVFCVCRTSLKTTVGKGEIAQNEPFLLFPQCFLPIWKLDAIFIKFEIVLCSLFQFGRVKNLSFGKRLIHFTLADAINMTESKMLLFGKELNIISNSIYGNEQCNSWII